MAKAPAKTTKKKAFKKKEKKNVPYGTVHIQASFNNTIVTFTDPIGNVQTFTYGSARRLTSVSNSAGETVTNVYDALGDATSVVVTKPTILPP